MGKGSCGRSSCTLAPSVLKKSLNVKEWESEKMYKPSYNVGPTSMQPVMIMQNGQRILRSMKWGLVPSFWKEGEMKDLSTINARCETLKTNNMWRTLVHHKRCVVIADGYFEWKKGMDNKKQPFFIHFTQGKIMKMAGLWDVWKNHETGEELYTYTIITTDAFKEMSEIHDRMPVILETEEDADKWIDCTKYTFDEASTVLHPYVYTVKDQKKEDKKDAFTSSLEWYTVPPLVNSVKNDSADCVARLDEWKTNGGIASYFTVFKKPKVEKVEVKEEKKQIKKDEDMTLDTSDNIPDLETLDEDEEDVSFEERRASLTSTTEMDSESTEEKGRKNKKSENGNEDHHRKKKKTK